MNVIPFEEELFALLVCPASKTPLKFVAGALTCTDPDCRRKYPIEDGIPIMLIEESTQLPADEWEGVMAADGPVSGGSTGPA